MTASYSWMQKTFFTSLPLIIFACVSMLSPQLGQADLVARYAGNNTANDSSGNGHHGTLVGDTTYAAGKFGNAFSFDGNADYVQVAASAALEPATLSISMWIDTIAENHIRLLADSSHGGGAASEGWALQINDANDLSFAYGNGGSPFPEVIRALPAGFFDGGFNHIAATFDGSLMSLYADGNLLGPSQAFTGTPNPSGGAIRLGQQASFNRPYQGLMDEVRIYNHTLSQSEVTALATAIPEPTSMGVLGLTALLLVSRRKRR